MVCPGITLGLVIVCLLQFGLLLTYIVRDSGMIPVISSLPTPTKCPPTKNTTTTTASSAKQDSSYDCDNLSSSVLIAIKSGGTDQKYRHRRQKWRESDKCGKAYAQANIPYKFMIGLPLEKPLNPTSHNQAAADTQQEIIDTKALQTEFRAHGDVEIMPLRDVYTEMHLKTFRILEWGVHQSYTHHPNLKLLVLHDDEYCVDLKALQALCRKTAEQPQPAQMYGGPYFWSKPGYEIQKAFDQSFSPYFSGWLYVLSVPLAQEIVEDVDTKFAGIYASHSEDLQVGRWVKKQHQRKDTPPVQVEVEKTLIVAA
ncbi:expressed unknown protein [Seminavis robusta]|uniref:Hexosyltransferase n=1 Tax=Seminavis robusta TaxID=568900 RepID=A0A9N8EKM4_9STRA|nr:expressed unknown protein [Seminavis robusta]|eukprot:Sro1304_g261110.1 n/a (312) ;mRNA; f:28142-29077